MIGAPVSAWAEVHGLIVRGLVLDGPIEQDLDAQERAWESSLVARGAQPNNIRVIEARGPEDRTVRERLLAALEHWQSGLDENDEAYLILLGHGTTRNDRYLFHVRGPRVTGQDLANAIGVLPMAALWVVVPGPGGHGLVDLLAGPKVNLISATDHARQINHPRFGRILADLMEAHPRDSLIELVVEANRYVEDYYKERKLVRTETAGVWVAGERVDIGNGDGGEPEPEADEPMLAVVDTAEWPADLVEPGPDATYEIRAHTPDEARRLKDAPSSPHSPGSMATVLQRRVAMDLKPDGSALWNEAASVVIHDMRGRQLIDNVWTSKCTSTGCSPVRLKALRIIRPDGHTLDWDYQAMPPMQLPGVVAGSLIEYDFETIANKPPLPYYSGQIALGISNADVVKQTVRLTHEPAHPIHYRLFDTDSYQIESTDTNGLSYVARTWEVGHLPPVHELHDMPRIALSGFERWEDIADFYRDMMRDTIGDAEAVAHAARSWTQNAPTRYDRIAALYERVNGFRYITIPLGVRGLRPEPASEVIQSRYGDCKAKANLLVQLLAALDIEAHFVLVQRGGEPDTLDPDFPAWAFNHAVVVVPDPQGTGEGPPLWLDATDGVCPLGMMPPGAPGRQALVLADEPYIATIPAFHTTASHAHEDGGLQAADPSRASSCNLDLTASPEGLTGAATWRLDGWLAYHWQLMRKAGDKHFKEAFAAACTRSWPTAVVTGVTVEALSPSSPLIVKAQLSFPHAVVALPNGQRLLTPPGPWGGDQLLPASHRDSPNGGYPGSYTQRLTLAWPEDWRLTAPPKSYASDTGEENEQRDYFFAAGPPERMARNASDQGPLYEATLGYTGTSKITGSDAIEDARAWRAHLTRPLIFNTPDSLEYH